MFRRDRTRLVCLVTATVFLAAHAAVGQPDSRFDTESGVDPVPAWAYPLKGGPIRVAAVFPADAQADLAALERQIDVRLVANPFGEATPFGDATAAALKSKPDVLLVAGGALADLPAEPRASLEQHINRGGGIVWIGFAPDTTAELPDFLTPLGLNALDPAPDFVTMAGGQALTGLQPGYDAFAAFRNDTARAVELRFWSTRPHGHALIPLAPQDALHSPESIANYLALACHVIRWTAGRDPAAAFRAVEEIAPQGPETAETPAQLPGRFVQRMQQAAVPGALRQFAVSLDRPAPRTFGLRMQVRYPGRGVSSTFEALDRFPKGTERITFSVPAGSGETFLDVWLLDGTNVVDWFTQPLHLSTMPALTEVSFSSAAVDANDRLRVSAKVEGRLQAEQPRTGSSQMPLSVYLRVTDAFGREVARRDMALAATGGDIAAELPLIDLLAPYARADVYASFAAEPTLDWWTRARADHRAFDLLVHQPLPEGLALIVDDPGEGSFAGSARRRAVLEQGVTFIAPGAFPALGNIAADGTRLVADLGGLDQFPGDEFGPRAVSGIALRQAAAPYAALQPGLYVVTTSSANDEVEARRAAMEKALRESDPRAVLALLSGGYSAANSGGFRVIPADLDRLHSALQQSAAYTTVRADLPTGDRAIERSRWLPWLAALHGANALWIDGSTTAPDSFAALTDESRRVRVGFDVLLRRASPETVVLDESLKIDPDFPGIVRKYSLGKVTLYAFLAHPDGDGKASLKLKAPDGARIYELTSLEAPVPAKNFSHKLRPGEVAVVAILPYEVTRIALEVPSAVPAGRRLTVRASVKTRGALPGDHVLRLSVSEPGGRELKHYGRTIVAPSGEGAVSVPLAFNDVPGKYRVTVRDVLTGLESTADLSVVVPQENGPGAAR